MKHYIFLIPGFFGFNNLGGIKYFRHVQELIEERLKQAGRHPVVHTVHTLPTASIRKRAVLLLEKILAEASEDSAPIHLIGHSTGGLDARLLATTHNDVAQTEEARAAVKRIRTVFAVSSPHRGTPMASVFSGPVGNKLLFLLSWISMYTLKYGHFPLNLLSYLAGAITKLDDKVGLENTALDDLYNQLFSDLSYERRQELKKMMSEILIDRSLLVQLTPDGMDIFNAAAPDSPDIRYYSVATMAKRPSLKAFAKIALNPYSLGGYSLFLALYKLTGPSLLTEDYRWSPDDKSIEMFIKAYSRIPEWKDNDGVVPTRSQLWGELLYAAQGDHLDVVGHYEGHDEKPVHINWLTSGCGFNRAAFREIWNLVAQKIMET